MSASKPMFTGLIEDVGETDDLRLNKGSALLTVRTSLPLRAMTLGASIAVNGACLTIVKKRRRAFCVDVSSETLRRTNLERLGTGARVNLERPMRLQDRLGGHWVTGHVDGLATVEAIEKKGAFTFFTFRVAAKQSRYLVAKGSVAIDGISLTVNDCGQRRFSVAIIPFTLRHTNLQARRVGDKVNLETDLLGKYVFNFLNKRG